MMDISYIVKPILVDGKEIIPLIELANKVKKDEWELLNCDYYRAINSRGDYLFEYCNRGFSLEYIGYSYKEYVDYKEYELYDYLEKIGINYRT